MPAGMEGMAAQKAAERLFGAAPHSIARHRLHRVLGAGGEKATAGAKEGGQKR